MSKALPKDFVDVYVAALPHGVGLPTVTDGARAEEIAWVKNAELKAQKTFVWKLLEYALEHSLGSMPSDVRFSKTAEGKWLCDACCFSLSHSKDALAVAVSRNAVGVDIELLSPPRQGVVERVLTDEERAVWQSCKDGEAWQYLLTAWAKKESAFKCCGQGAYVPSKINTEENRFAVRTVEVAGQAYVLAVATQTPDAVRYLDEIDLAKLV